MMCRNCKRDIDHTHSNVECIANLRASNERMRTALEWYADPTNNGARVVHFNSEHDWDYFVARPIDEDDGEVAITALKEEP